MNKLTRFAIHANLVIFGLFAVAMVAQRPRPFGITTASAVPPDPNTVTAAGTLTASLPMIGDGLKAAAVGTRSGNTTAFVTTTGSQTSGKCVVIDASGNHVADANACGGGALGGDLSGTPAAATVAKVDGVTVDMHSTAPINDQILCYVAATTKYIPCTINTQSIKPGNVKVSSSSVLLINDGCSAGSPCYVGQSEFTSSATATITGGSGSGTAKVYKCGSTTSTHCPTANAITVSHPSAGGLTISCVGCTEIQKSTPTVPVGAVSLYSATFASGAWTTVTDQRVFVTQGVGSTTTQYITYKVAVCQNTSASLGFSLPVSNPATASCITGSNSQLGMGNFADSSNLSVQDYIYLPPDWTSTIDVKFRWRTSATSGAVVWQVATACVTDAETIDPSWNTASVIADTAKGTTLQMNDAEIEGLTVTGCAPAETMLFKVFRDSAHASDTLAATAQLMTVTFVIRRETL